MCVWWKRVTEYGRNTHNRPRIELTKRSALVARGGALVANSYFKVKP